MKPLLRAFAISTILLLFGGCVTPPPPTAAEIQAKRFEPVPGKAVVYLYRDQVNFPTVAAPIALDGSDVGANFAGTFFRFVVDPGEHRISGTVADIGSIRFKVEPNQIYFVQQTALVTRTVDLMGTVYNLVDPAVGRARVSEYQLIGQ
jgi:hypothetical protein